MDSKFIQINSDYFLSYVIIHQVYITSNKSLSKAYHQRFSLEQLNHIIKLIKEDLEKTIYCFTKGDVALRMQMLSLSIYKILRLLSDQESEIYLLLERAVYENFIVAEEQIVLLRPMEEIRSESIQSPYDPDSTSRHKQDQKVKGHNINLEKTFSNIGLNLITGVLFDKTHVSDIAFLELVLQESMQITDYNLYKMYMDGGYQYFYNGHFCQHLDIFFPCIRGFVDRYDFSSS